jgi:uncharacterized protein YkwD
VVTPFSFERFGSRVLAKFPSAAEVHRGFMHSPHHRENLLNPDYNVAGFAVVRNGNTIYVTEDFGHGQSNR